MGFRTIVILNNDLCHEWQSDPFLGEKIAEAMNRIHYEDKGKFLGGQVVECTHSSSQTLALIDYFSMDTLAVSSSDSNNNFYPEKEIKLLRQAAEKFGYRLVKKPVRKEKNFRIVNSTGELSQDIKDQLGMK